jgi:hypothetical protein
MKLKVVDQILVSSVDSDTLRPGREIEVSDELGKDLLERHPTTFSEVGGEKAARAPANKARKAAPANKSAKPKGKK